jgi:hypothetical protein
LSGVWRVLQACGLGLHAACARLFSPDPDYRRKVRRLHRCCVPSMFDSSGVKVPYQPDGGEG